MRSLILLAVLAVAFLLNLAFPRWGEHSYTPPAPDDNPAPSRPPRE